MSSRSFEEEYEEYYEEPEELSENKESSGEEYEGEQEEYLFPLQKLPPEIQHKIMRKMNQKELGRMKGTSKLYNALGKGIKGKDIEKYHPWERYVRNKRDDFEYFIDLELIDIPYVHINKGVEMVGERVIVRDPNLTKSLKDVLNRKQLITLYIVHVLHSKDLSFIPYSFFTYDELLRLLVVSMDDLYYLLAYSSDLGHVEELESHRMSFLTHSIQQNLFEDLFVLLPDRENAENAVRNSIKYIDNLLGELNKKRKEEFGHIPIESNTKLLLDCIFTQGNEFVLSKEHKMIFLDWFGAKKYATLHKVFFDFIKELYQELYKKGVDHIILRALINN